MKKFYFSFLLIIASLSAYSHSIKDFSFTIIFAGRFENDLVSLNINKKNILNKYTVDNSDVVKRGHLSLTQYEKDIKISYNGQSITKPGISVKDFLDIDITVNGRKETIKVDLRKGNILLVDCVKENAKTKKVTIEQLEEPYIII